MRVLVNGQLGHIGTVMVPMLLKSGHQVVGLDSNLYVHLCRWRHCRRAAYIRKDTRNEGPPPHLVRAIF